MWFNQPDIPFAPRRVPLFYGWVILVVTTIGMLASLPGQTMGVGVFKEDLISALQIDSTQISFAYMCGTLMSGFTLPFAGRFLDLVGARVMTVLSSLILGFSMLLLAYAQPLAARLPLSQLWASTVTVGLIFFLMRFTGQGCLTLASRVALSKWFDRRRGLVVGIMGVFVAFGFNSSPKLLNELLERFEWRGAALILAASVGLGMTLLAWLTYRDNPEECGLLPDGRVSESPKAVPEASPPNAEGKFVHTPRPVRVHVSIREFTRRQALLTPTFWAFALALGAQAFIFTALTFHIVDLGDRNMLSRDTAYTIFLPMSFFGVSLNFISGWASDRYPIKWQLIAMMATQAIGTLGLLTFGDFSGRLLMIVGYGMSMGIFGCLMTTPWPKFYGRLHLGGIAGVVSSVVVLASAVAPPVYAWGAAWFGDYVLAEVVSLLPAVALMIFGLFADNPQDQFKTSSAQLS